jgi:hypothetical protein
MEQAARSHETKLIPGIHAMLLAPLLSRSMTLMIEAVKFLTKPV